MFDCRRGTDAFQLIITGRVAATEHNAMRQLFSASPKRVQAGASSYHMKTDDGSTL